MGKKKNLLILITLAAYLISAGISYSVFSEKGSPTEDTETQDIAGGGPKTNDYDAIEFDQSKPKTEECPLNGVKYSKDQKKWWESHRPLGVMIENHTEARPQSGMSFADVVYEAVAEGGITRFLTVFYCQDAGRVGPVRSARTYFLDYISEYGAYPLYAHVGGANTPGPANALGQIADYDWLGYNDLSGGFSVGFPTFKRIENLGGRSVATEHTMYANTSLLWKVGKERGLTNKDKEGDAWDDAFEPYSFKDDAGEAQRGTAQSVHIEHWEGYDDFFVDWTFDPTTNSYKRNNGGEAHTDRNGSRPLSAKNIVVLYMAESRANDGYEGNAHLIYKNKGKGKADIFLDGKEINGNWSKDGRTGRTELTDASGKEVKLNRGTIWFHIMPLAGVVTAK